MDNTPYTRHRYKIKYINKSQKIFDTYEEVLREWFINPSCEIVEVLDKKSNSKGFK